MADRNGRMIKFIATIVMSLALLSSAQAQMTPKDAAVHLEQSVVALKRGWGSPFCTGFKIEAKTFLTAGHCANSINSNTRLVSNFSNDYLYVRSIIVTTQEKSAGNRDEDWAILNTTTEAEELASLALACDEEVYLGMPVAYAGYTQPMDFAFGLGTVMSLNRVSNSMNDLDFVVDLQAAPGASGSPVISLDTGDVIGVLTEGVFASRAGAFGVGIEHIANLDICEDYLKDKGESPVLPAVVTPF